MKNRVTIRMGAGEFTADVRNGDQVVSFNLNKMDKQGQRTFVKELVFAFRVAGEAK